MEHGALIFAFVLVLLNGFFVAVEFALVKVRPTQLEALVEQRVPGAAAARSLQPLAPLKPAAATRHCGISNVRSFIWIAETARAPSMIFNLRLPLITK